MWFPFEFLQIRTPPETALLGLWKQKAKKQNQQNKNKNKHKGSLDFFNMSSCLKMNLETWSFSKNLILLFLIKIFLSFRFSSNKIFDLLGPNLVAPCFGFKAKTKRFWEKNPVGKENKSQLWAHGLRSNGYVDKKLQHIGYVDTRSKSLSSSLFPFV